MYVRFGGIVVFWIFRRRVDNGYFELLFNFVFVVFGGREMENVCRFCLFLAFCCSLLGFIEIIFFFSGVRFGFRDEAWSSFFFRWGRELFGCCRIAWFMCSVGEYIFCGSEVIVRGVCFLGFREVVYEVRYYFVGFI